jgi:hypothetical protein
MSQLPTAKSYLRDFKKLIKKQFLPRVFVASSDKTKEFFA